jgi:cytochrome c oxidase subunit 2
MSSFGAHPGATSEGHQTYQLWQGFTIGAIVVGGLTLALIVYAAVRFRVRPGQEGVPRQTQYHLPLEIVYTVIPVLIVLVLFAFTVVVENNVTALPAPALTIRVQAFQWGWRFFYPPAPGTPAGTVKGPYAFTIAGQTTQTPTMEMPANENVRIVLQSLDVVHGFYLPSFNFSRQALPGVTNEYNFYPQQTGTFFGQCTQYCGLYHSLMWFKVKVVPAAAYASWARSQQTQAANLAAIAAAGAALSQGRADVPVRPDIGGGTN